MTTLIWSITLVGTTNRSYSMSVIHTFLVRTEILPFDPQPGMKSEQTLDVDFTSRTVRSSSRTGHTHIGPITLSAARSKFSVFGVVFSPTGVTFTAVGTTASGVLVLPNIDYSIRFQVIPAGTGWIDGNHDGYPAYKVSKGSKVVYAYLHKPMELWKLAGISSVLIARRSF